MIPVLHIVFKSIPYSDFTLSGREPFPDVVNAIYDEINKIYGTKHEPAL